MDNTTTISQVLQQYIQLNNIRLTDMADELKINRGMLSGAINKKPPKILSIKMIDAVTEYMKLPEGYYYYLYVNECFRDGMHWRRTKPFIIRCAELGEMACIDKVITRMAEDIKNLGHLFEVAEELFQTKHTAAATKIYECIVQTERYIQSDRLAISYYRLFQLYRSDQDEVIRVAIQFMPYRDRIPEDMAMNGLLLLAHTFAIREDWEKVATYGRELVNLCQGIYKHREWDRYTHMERPFVYYYGQGYLLMAGYYEITENYEQAKKWLAGYADLSWMEGLDDRGHQEVKDFSLYAHANDLSIELKTGNKNVINEYIQLLRENPSELLNGLWTLLEASNKFNYSVNHVLNEFKGFLECKVEDLANMDQYKREFSILNYVKLNHEYAIYCLKQSIYHQGIDRLLISFEAAVSISNAEGISKAMGLFEIYRSYSRSAQIDTFNNISRRYMEHEIKGYALDFGGIR